MYIDATDCILVVKDFVSNGTAEAVDDRWDIITKKLIRKFGLYIFIVQDAA